jgi:hypothetical protein
MNHDQSQWIATKNIRGLNRQQANQPFVGPFPEYFFFKKHVGPGLVYLHVSLIQNCQ